MSWTINIFQERCTGCRACQMICSYANEKGFQPFHAYLKIKEENHSQFNITFDDRCKKCGLCASYCSAGALVKERRV